MRSLRRLGTILLATAVAALVIASCGDDEPTPAPVDTATTTGPSSTPTESTSSTTSTGGTATTDTAAPAPSLADGAAGLCARYRSEAGELAPRDDDPTAYERDLAAIEARTLAGLRALTVPDDQRAAFDAYVDAQATAFGAVAALRTSGESGEGDGPAATKANEARANAQKLAFALGFDSCTQV